MTPVAGSSTTDSGWARPLVSHRSSGADAAVLKAIRVAVSATTTGRMVLLARWFGMGLGNGGPARIRTLNPLLRRQMLYPLSYGTTQELPDYNRNSCQCVQRSGRPNLKFSA